MSPDVQGTSAHCNKSWTMDTGMKILVQKFGGTSVATLECMKQVREKVQDASSAAARSSPCFRRAPGTPINCWPWPMSGRPRRTRRNAMCWFPPASRFPSAFSPCCSKMPESAPVHCWAGRFPSPRTTISAVRASSPLTARPCATTSTSTMCWWWPVSKAAPRTGALPPSAAAVRTPRPWLWQLSGFGGM